MDHEAANTLAEPKTTAMKPSAASPLAIALGFIAVIFGSANVFGGFMVTDRMLQMFKKKKK